MSFILDKRCRFTATIVSNRRDTHKMHPKRLLIDVVCEDNGNEYRDHCWVKENSRLLKHISMFSEQLRKTGVLHISFSAIPEMYDKTKYGLASLRNVRERDYVWSEHKHTIAV